MGRLKCRFHRIHTLLLQVFGKFDNQNGVFRAQTNHGNQTDSEIDIVQILRRHAKQGEEAVAAGNTQHHAEEAQRHDQNHGERNRPAFIQCGQHEEDGQNRQAVNQIGLRAAFGFFARLPTPFQAVAAFEFIHQPFHFGHCLSCGVAAGSHTFQFHGRITVEAHALLHAVFPFRGSDGGQRHGNA